jgi:NAD(P)H-hydrate repair Nnr-like enzyme with NAD(P)H-hydrate dehydratase domain
VLTGLLGALLAQAPERPLDMARLGVWLHAEAGRLAGEHMDRGLCAGDLSEWLPEAWRELAGEARVLWQW